MRYSFIVDRDKEWTALGLRITGLDDASKPIVIVAVVPGSLVDMVNQWNASVERLGEILGEIPVERLGEILGGTMHRVQPGDIIVSANGCSKERHGAEMVRIVLQVDRRVVFDMHREDYDPWDMRGVSRCAIERQRSTNDDTWIRLWKEMTLKRERSKNDKTAQQEVACVYYNAVVAWDAGPLCDVDLNRNDEEKRKQ